MNAHNQSIVVMYSSLHMSTTIKLSRTSQMRFKDLLNNVPDQIGMWNSEQIEFVFYQKNMDGVFSLIKLNDLIPEDAYFIWLSDRFVSNDKSKTCERCKG